MSDQDTLPRVIDIAAAGPVSDQVALTYDGRFLRRKRLVSDAGTAFLVDLAKTTNLGDGAVLVLDNGLRIGVQAAPEPLIEVRGPLARLAWHIGNRHTPCQIGPDHLRILDDHVLAKMLHGLGAELTHVTAPFLPEGGAYGLGRTMPHGQGPDDAHAHAHAH
ncbi:urease accessory protein UreE [Pseudoruegeria sp. SK021]|uniref:urease accessory protein UreE n=1 Tax=Pseudoruegeria sp. SK021 TaxID=1933035 RepID=UPI000A2440E8|nr:urease accessory protein UreE [Pseudoruegeria sp. SK021]OSP56337.1 urease accessory protein UreE [Pseudoruegeria sp. SK021]